MRWDGGLWGGSGGRGGDGLGFGLFLIVFLGFLGGFAVYGVLWVVVMLSELLSILCFSLHFHELLSFEPLHLLFPTLSALFSSFELIELFLLQFFNLPLFKNAIAIIKLALFLPNTLPVAAKSIVILRILSCKPLFLRRVVIHVVPYDCLFDSV